MGDTDDAVIEVAGALDRAGIPRADDNGRLISVAVRVAVLAEENRRLREAAQHAVDVARSYDSTGRLPEFAQRLADAFGGL